MTAQLDTDTARLISRLAELQDRIADLNSEAEAIKAELRALPPGEHLLDGEVALRIIPSRRLDVTAAAALLDEATRQACLKVDYDAAKIKQHLTPAQVDTCMVEAGKPKVVLG